MAVRKKPLGDGAKQVEFECDDCGNGVMRKNVNVCIAGGHKQ